MGSTRAAQPGHLVIAALLANPMLTQAQVAEVAGVSRQTVGSVATMLKEAASDNKVELEAYKMLLRERVPVEKRVAALATVVDKADSNPFAALRGVEYVDNALGLGPKQQQTQDVTDNTRPMFVLPMGTKVSMSIQTPDQAIDVTPLQADDDGFKHDL